MVNLPNPAFPFINGGLMQSFVGQQASLMGRFESLEANGRMMKVKLTDGNMIVATISSPLTEPVQSGTYVLLQGVVENRNKFKPSAINFIPPDLCVNFEDSLWNDWVAISQENQDLIYNFDDMIEHYGVSDPTADGGNVEIISFPNPDSAAETDSKALGDSFNEQSFTEY